MRDAHLVSFVGTGTFTSLKYTSHKLVTEIDGERCIIVQYGFFVPKGSYGIGSFEQKKRACYYSTIHVWS